MSQRGNLEPDTSLPTLRVGFVLCPNFTLVAFSGFVDALRLAADDGDRSRPIHCRWEVLSHDQNAIRSSAGIEVRPTALLGDAGAFDYLVVVGGLLNGKRCPEPERAFLREAARCGVPLVGLCTGSFVLAQLGLMQGARCCVSWFHRDAFVAEFPQLAVTSEALYVVDQDRLTCAGGTSVVHLAAHILRSHGMPGPADKALRILIESGVPPEHAVQPAPLLSEAAQDPRLRRSLLLMERTIENPLSCEFVARQVQLSVRQLERLFKLELGLSPSVYAERLRLARAHELIRHTDEPVIQIALRCGYKNNSHFSNRFKRVYGNTPSALRRTPSKPQPPAPTPD